jgi:predicted phosphoribosyltransferase
MYFRNREHAGKELANALQKYRDSNAVVYALPRGGVALGAEIAAMLHLPLDILVARKIGHPLNPEYAIAAITEHGAFVSTELEGSHLDREWIDAREQQEKQEALRRRKAYMAGRKSFPATGKIAILVDDGLATGLTMEAAIKDLKKQKPTRIIVAIPVAPRQTAISIRKKVDELVVLDAPEEYLGAVGSYYADFHQVTDPDVMEMLDRVNPRMMANQQA